MFNVRSCCAIQHRVTVALVKSSVDQRVISASSVQRNVATVRTQCSDVKVDRLAGVVFLVIQ